MITLKLTDDIKKISKDINLAIAKYINSQIQKRNKSVTKALKQKVRSWVSTQPEILDLKKEGVSNTLFSELGLRLGTSKTVTEAIINSVINSTEVKITKLNSKLEGGVEFNFQPKNFLNLLGLKEGHVITKKGTDLHWLNWLLTMGDTIIIVGYTYKPTDEGRSRSGTMASGGYFRVNPSFSGTVENNFITRSFKNREQEISDILKGFFE